MNDASRVSARYLVPIPGMVVPARWTVGRVTFRPGETARDLLGGTPPARFRDGGDFAPELDRILRETAGGAVAEVTDTVEAREAIAAVRMAVDALRLFAASRRITRTLPFGLPGEVAHGIVEYIVLGEAAAAGWVRAGEPTGGGFDRADQEAWDDSAAFGFLSAAMADPTASEGARRAAIGAQLFSRAAIEQRPDIKMLGVVATLEAWLLARGKGSQTLRLARHVSWFGCGSHDGNLCGRNRPVCPYLRLKPGEDNGRLKKLRDLGNTHVPWRCSEWHRVMDWYDARSGAAHGGDPSDVDHRDADNAAFWVARYLAEPILDWLRTHPDDPIGALDVALDLIPEPADWPAMVAALAAEPPPATPP